MNTAANPATATGQRVVRVVDARVLCSRIGAVDLDRCRECDYLIRLRVTGKGRSAEGEVICSDAGVTPDIEFAW